MDPKNQKIEHEVADRIAILPLEIKEIVTDGYLQDAIEELARIYEFNKMQQVLLENEIMIILMLFLPRSEFKQNIRSSLEIDESTADQIDQYVEAEIFIMVDDILEVVELQFQQTLDAANQTAEDTVHGYHAYRTINPHDDGEPVIKSLSQDDVLASKNRLANTPRYGEDAQT